VIDRHAFEFRLPAEFSAVPVQPIDSWVEQFATTDSTQVVTFDYGWFSDDLHLDPGLYSQYQSCTEMIGGRKALIVVVRLRNEAHRRQGGTYAVAATWRDVHGDDDLTLSAWTPDVANIDRLLGVLRTVRFPTAAPSPSSRD
jgi:hypothetical protein